MYAAAISGFMADPSYDEKMTDRKDGVDVVETGSLEAKTEPVLDHRSVDPVYQAKAHVLNNAVQQIGMGRYQWELVSIRFPSRSLLNSNVGLLRLRYLDFVVSRL